MQGALCLADILQTVINCNNLAHYVKKYIYIKNGQMARVNDVCSNIKYAIINVVYCKTTNFS